MGRGRLEVLVDNAWRTHVGRRGGEGCYDTYRSALYRDPRASPWPLRVTGVSYARARQRPGGLTVSPHARFGTASGGGRKCGEKRRGVGRRAAPRTAGHPSRGRDTCGSEGRSPPRRALSTALATRRACCLKARRRCPSSPIPASLAVVSRALRPAPPHLQPRASVVMQVTTAAASRAPQPRPLAMERWALGAAKTQEYCISPKPSGFLSAL
jgi:hypothetical protein